MVTWLVRSLERSAVCPTSERCRFLASGFVGFSVPGSCWGFVKIQGNASKVLVWRKAIVNTAMCCGREWIAPSWGWRPQIPSPWCHGPAVGARVSSPPCDSSGNHCSGPASRRGKNSWRGLRGYCMHGEPIPPTMWWQVHGSCPRGWRLSTVRCLLIMLKTNLPDFVTFKGKRTEKQASCDGA